MQTAPAASAPDARKTHCLYNPLKRHSTQFTDFGDYVLVELVRGNLIRESTRMSRKDARDEWSAMVAFCIRSTL